MLEDYKGEERMLRQKSAWHFAATH
jgi:hypothetical protein